MKITRLFGNRVVVTRLDEPPPVSPFAVPDDDDAAFHLPPSVRAKPGPYVPLPEGLGRYYAKGRVEVIGQPVKDDDVLSQSVIADESPLDNMRMVKELLETYVKFMTNRQDAPLPPLKVGDVVIYAVGMSIVLPESTTMYTVEASGIVAVVGQRD